MPVSVRGANGMSTKDNYKNEAANTDTAVAPVYEDEDRLVVVGIGSSAGGLEALTEFVSHLKPTGRMTFIIAQHLSPTHRSMLEELLSRDTALPIKQLKRTTRPQPDTIYLTPPNRHVIMEGGAIKIRPPKIKRGPVPSADALFSSLAREFGEYSGAIVLSGTGSDGAAGIEDIKKAGGITGAQDDTAAYDGMPVAARSTQAVDLIARPSDLAEKFTGLAAGAYTPVGLMDDDDDADVYDSIIAILRTETHNDYSDYRVPTILRRMARRMALLNIGEETGAHERYLEYLQSHPEEVEALSNELLIGVTSFFRDSEQFKAAQAIIEDLVNEVADNREIRAWVPGCSTGEEAYSIALLFSEALRRAGKTNTLRVFATDIDVRALAAGRRGRYASTLDERLPDTLVSRYFAHVDHGYQVSQQLRDTVVFSKHNVIQDPPFSKIDFLSCRNLFIYFNTKLQHRTLERFHYSLRKGGVLFLGRSENLGDGIKLFSEIDKKSRLFRANAAAVPRYRPVSAAEHVRLEDPARPLRPPPLNREEFKAYRAIAKTMAPPTIMLDEQDEPVHLHGDLTPYIKLPSGQAEFHINNIVKPEFRSEFMALLLRARRDKIMVSSQVLRADHQGDAWRFRILVQPYTDTRPDQDSLLVSFPVVTVGGAVSDAELEETTLNTSQREEELEHELATMREHLRTLVEELETSNEELQSLNEELQSSNEELQSTNEELETSNEELQATNEELTTVNEELNVKTDEIRQSNAFLVSILETIDHPVLVTDRNLEILNYNKSAARLVGLESDVRKLNSETLYGEVQLSKTLSNMAARAIQRGKRATRQIESGGKWYKIAAQPYYGTGKDIVGSVLILDDITAPKAANLKLKEHQKRLEEITGQQAATLDSLPANVALLDSQGRIVAVNKAWAQFGSANGLSNGETFIGVDYIALCENADGPCSEEAPVVAAKLRDVLTGRLQRFDLRYPCHAPEQERWFRCSGTVVNAGNEIGGVVVMHVDETPNVELEQSLMRARKNAEDASNAKSLFLTTMSHELRTPLNAVLGFSELQKMEAYGPLGHDKYREYSNDIHSEARRLLEQIDSILDLSKVESGKIEISETDFAISDCQRSVFKLFEHRALDSELTLKSVLPENLPMLRADEGMTRQMLVNLVGNATKFTGPGGSIEFEAEEFEHGWYALRVRDTGVGIPKNKLDMITRPFEQVRSTFTTDNSGIGLGLAVVNSMINLHGGKMDIESEENVGTCVSLLFPPGRVIRSASHN